MSRESSSIKKLLFRAVVNTILICVFYAILRTLIVASNWFDETDDTIIDVVLFAIMSVIGVYSIRSRVNMFKAPKFLKNRVFERINDISPISVLFVLNLFFCLFITDFYVLMMMGRVIEVKDIDYSNIEKVKNVDFVFVRDVEVDNSKIGYFLHEHRGRGVNYSHYEVYPLANCEDVYLGYCEGTYSLDSYHKYNLPSRIKKNMLLRRVRSTNDLIYYKAAIGQTRRAEYLYRATIFNVCSNDKYRQMFFSGRWLYFVMIFLSLCALSGALALVGYIVGVKKRTSSYLSWEAEIRTYRDFFCSLNGESFSLPKLFLSILKSLKYIVFFPYFFIRGLRKIRQNTFDVQENGSEKDTRKKKTSRK